MYQWGNASELERYSENLKGIRPLVLWPPPRQLERAGWKLTVISDLTLIAEQNVHSLRPKTRKLSFNSIIPSNTVLKRSHSDCSTHVIMPSDSKRRTWKYLSTMAPGGELWISQEHIPTLETFGEWRVFIIRGRILHVVHTHRRGKGRYNWHGTRVENYRSLEDMRSVFSLFTILYVNQFMIGH